MVEVYNALNKTKFINNDRYILQKQFILVLCLVLQPVDKNLFKVRREDARTVLNRLFVFTVDFEQVFAHWEFSYTTKQFPFVLNIFDFRAARVYKK